MRTLAEIAAHLRARAETVRAEATERYPLDATLQRMAELGALRVLFESALWELERAGAREEGKAA